MGGSGATSSGSVAEDYDRVRPGRAPAALGWLVPSGVEVLALPPRSGCWRSGRR